MRTKNIFKTVALAMLMPAMLLTTACSNDDDLVNNEPTVNKGYALPVTVSATRQGDATTRATYNESTKKLEFSTGDKLFVNGNDNSVGGAGQFAGTLDYVPATGKFSGTIYTQNSYEGTADALFTDANEVYATLLPNGYESYNFLSIIEESPALYDDRVIADANAFVASETAKATGVAQLSYERASTYNSGIGFALAPLCAILNFTISGLEAGAQDVTLSVTRMGTEYDVTGSVTPNASGVATFAIGVPAGFSIKDVSMSNNLSVGSHKFTLPGGTALAAGNIYNIARNAIPGALIGQFSVSDTKKVYFSKGNLQATYDGSGSGWTWAFAANQWNYIGNAEGNTKVSGSDPFVTGYTGSSTTVDLFGWSTSTTYLGIHKSRDDGDYSGDFVDWGSHADVTAGIGSGWCTLSKDEWLYLFYGRSDAENKYGYATVNGVYGIIFLPDAFVDPKKNNGSDAFVGSATDWVTNVYTAANWALMEKNGAVFLPAAGYRDEADVDVDGDRGYYWSSSAYGDEEAYYLYFVKSDEPDALHVDNNTDRYNGMSVRLVRPVQ